MKKIIAALIVCTAFFQQDIQAQIIESGTIVFKKTTNLHMTMKLEYADQLDQSSGFSMDDILKIIPKHATQDCIMTFDKDKSMYRFDKKGPEKIPFDGNDPAGQNIVYKDFTKNTYTAQKEVMEEVYIVEDSIVDYTWKITDEIRVIAGFTCRKATTVINDSVVVVAFYTDDIAVSSGPESFGGLPGMILGLAVPRLYTTWFATEFRYSDYDKSLEKEFIQRRTKKVNYEQLGKELNESLKEWGKFGEGVIYRTTL